MKSYKITYRSSDGDISSVWCEASSREDAIEQTKREYWDIEEIISISILK